MSGNDDQEALFKEKGKEWGRKPKRHLPLDVIYTFSRPDHISAHLAHDAGWLIGIRSDNWTYCQQDHVRPRWETRFKLQFMDNRWHGYDHAQHVQAVKECQPKYATVRDYVTEDMAKREGIEYFTFDEVLDMASELAEYTENAIVIPKVESVIDAIPERFMLGYSVPSSYGRTQIPIERFAGHRVHLLGGSWATQRGMLAKLGDDIVSVDLNHPVKIAKYGQFVMPDGTTRDLGWLNVFPHNRLAVCMALSLGHIASSAKHLAVLQALPTPEPEEGVPDGA